MKQTSDYEGVMPQSTGLLDSKSSDVDQLKDLQEVHAAWAAAKSIARKKGYLSNRMIAKVFKQKAGLATMAKESVVATLDPGRGMVHVLAAERIALSACARAVRDLAARCFGQDVSFDPPNDLSVIAGEPVLFVKTAAPYSMQKLMYFSEAMDRDTRKYCVSYVMPDKDHGPNSIRVCFFKGFRPSR